MAFSSLRVWVNHRLQWIAREMPPWWAFRKRQRFVGAYHAFTAMREVLDVYAEASDAGADKGRGDA